MLLRMLVASAFALCAPTAVLAQTGTGSSLSLPTEQSPPISYSGQPDAAEQRSAQPGTRDTLPGELRQKLADAGFSEVRIVPTSFVVIARDRSGEPVLMRIGPSAMAMLTEMPASSESPSAGRTPGTPDDVTPQSERQAPSR